MRLLMLGGTRFVGRAVVDEALRRSWSVTVFNRGTHPAPDGVTQLRGDRTSPAGLQALGAGTWDVVVDTWSWAPRAVRDAAELLSTRAGHYVYISSRSVYAPPVAPGADEDAPLVGGDASDGDVDYARAKVGGETAASGAFGHRALLARAGLIVGPHEDVGRLPWWLERMSAGETVLAPGPPDAEVQLLDARDLAAWCLTAAEQGLGGPYNLASPPGHVTMRDLLEACVDVVGSQAELRWVDPEPIVEAGIEPWTQLPIWLPPGPDHDLAHRADVSKAVAVGLTCRPLAQTVTDTWAWMRGLDRRLPQRHDRALPGLDPNTEARVLARQADGSPHGSG